MNTSNLYILALSVKKGLSLWVLNSGATDLEQSQLEINYLNTDRFFAIIYDKTPKSLSLPSLIQEYIIPTPVHIHVMPLRQRFSFPIESLTALKREYTLE
jgi:hypothetical protein